MIDFVTKGIYTKAGVYMIKIGPHTYVGSTVELRKRFRTHRNQLKNNKHDNGYLQRAYNKYGDDQTFFIPLQIYNNITVEKLRKRELLFIQQLCPDLNLKPDPTTEQNCITTSKKVYEFNAFGEFIKE